MQNKPDNYSTELGTGDFLSGRLSGLSTMGVGWWFVIKATFWFSPLDTQKILYSKTNMSYNSRMLQQPQVWKNERPMRKDYWDMSSIEIVVSLCRISNLKNI